MRLDPTVAIQPRTDLGAMCCLGSVLRPVRPVQPRFYSSHGAPILIPTTTQRRAFQTLLCGVVSWLWSDPFMLIFLKRDGSEIVGARLLSMVSGVRAGGSAQGIAGRFADSGLFRMSGCLENPAKLFLPPSMQSRPPPRYCAQAREVASASQL